MKKRSLRILFFIGSMSSGGAERVISILANSFSENHIVRVTPIYKDILKYDLHLAVQYTPIVLPEKSKGLKRNLYRLRRMRSIVKEFNPDIVISFLTTVNIFTILALTGMNIPLVLSERNAPNFEVPNKLLQCIRDILYNVGSKNYFVFQTENAKNIFSNKIKKRSTIIYNPLNKDIPERYTGIRDKRIVCVARLERAKNHYMLFRAFSAFTKKHADYILELYGEGPLYEKLQLYADKLNIDSKLVFKGFSKNIYAEINSAMMFVLPSDYEGISNAMLEALALGIPTICTDCPAYGGRIFIKDGFNGYLIPVNDDETLMKRMDEIASSPELVEKLSFNSQGIRQELDETNIINKWMEYVGDIIENQFYNK